MLLLGKQPEKAKEEDSGPADHKAAGHQAMTELIEGMGRKDASACWAAFESAFQICEMAPHDEAGDDDEED